MNSFANYLQILGFQNKSSIFDLLFYSTNKKTIVRKDIKNKYAEIKVLYKNNYYDKYLI